MSMNANTIVSPDAGQHADGADAASGDDPGPSRRSTQTPSTPDEPLQHTSCALEDATGRLTIDELRWITDHVQRAMDHLACSGEVRARIINDREMSEAHQRHCKVPGTTDVITFDLRENPESPLDTDLLLCLDEADRQAMLRAHPVPRELLLYIIHAILHCLGYDDHDDESYRTMHAREDEILAALGVGTTFHVQPRDDQGAGSDNSR